MQGYQIWLEVERVNKMNMEERNDKNNYRQHDLKKKKMQAKTKARLTIITKNTTTTTKINLTRLTTKKILVVLPSSTPSPMSPLDPPSHVKLHI